MENKILKIGDTVNWRGAWGTQKAENAVVESIQRGRFDGDKDGKDIESVSWSSLSKGDRRYLVTLTNGHWAWANQIDKI
jgi:hypothetical protein